MAMNSAKRKEMVLALKGSEPSLSPETYNTDFLKALNYYNSENDDKDKKKWLITYVAKQDKKLAVSLTKVDEKWFRHAGIMARLVTNGSMLLEKEELFLSNKIQELTIRANVKDAPIKVSKPVTNVIPLSTIQERMDEKAHDLAGEIDKTDSTIHYNAGFLANDLGRFEDAKRHFGYLLELPTYNKTNAYYFMVQILSTEEKNPEAAFALVTKALAEYPNDKVLAEYEIQLLLQLNKMDEAMAQIKDALARDPNNPGLLLRSGYLKEQGGDLEAALVDYKKSVEVDPNYFEGNYYTGALMLEKSRGILAELNSLSDAEWEKRSQEMGKLADELYRQSVPYFTKALEIKADNTDIMIILFQVHTRLKNTAEVSAMNAKISAILGANWQEN